ncbi:MAG: hypothetical protein JSU63_20150 [Phycisphaerales bacterium]|nr:MAG: hypothetical protein JSU63_20150 [Phycisphaerales bacterium]
MREIRPYRTAAGLRKALDNGGRFYNLWSTAGDDIVTKAELAEAAGALTAGSTAFLFLEMAQQDLPVPVQKAAIAMLEPALRKEYQRKRPGTLSPSLVEPEGKAGRSVIVTGYPRLLMGKMEFDGCIMVPIMIGSVSTVTMVSIFDRYDVYEVSDDSRLGGPKAIVAVPHGSKFQRSERVRFGGVLKELKYKDKRSKQNRFYLEAVFYTRLPNE